MNQDDYKLLINICQQCLRSPLLSLSQVSDIDLIINKLFIEMSKTEESSQLCYGKKLKVGAKQTATKQIGQKSRMKKTRTITHGQS